MDMKSSGKIIAVAVGSLFATAVLAASPETSPASTSAAVHCYGVNSCKGQSTCKTAHNACKGLNSCKGKGVLEMSKADCKAKNGTEVPG